MKFIISFILTILLRFALCLFLPWWSIAIISFLVALLVKQKAGMAFAAGFSGLVLLWTGLAWWINVKNENILSARIGELLGIGNNPFLLITITAIIGGLVAGFAAMSGSYLRSDKE